jgi:hypothetical protein
MNSRNNSKNIKGFKPALSGHPVGSPTKRPVTDAYLRALKTVLPDEIRLGLQLAKGSTWADALARRQVLAAFRGKTNAVRELREAIEGKAGERIEAAGANRKVIMHVVYENETKPQSPASPPTKGPVSSEADKSGESE